MISEVIQYGGAIYWLLLFCFCVVTSFHAEKREGILVPSLWGVATLTFVFGFTTYRPDPLEFSMGVAAYILFGVIFTTAKWANLIYRVSYFVKTLEPYFPNDYEMRHMAHEAFRPMDADDVMTLPPDPFEFRTRLSAWFLFWPAFTVFRCFSQMYRWFNQKLWGFFYDLSKRLYVR